MRFVGSQRRAVVYEKLNRSHRRVGDTPVFSSALSAEDNELWVATSRLNATIENILKSVNCIKYKIFVSGKENFRKQIDPNYKANRTQPDPKWREECKQHLIKQWGAIEAHGCEADDYCGIYQSEDTIICGIDKDLLQITGKHFQWEIVRKGKVVREAQFIEISKLEGYRNFYKQMLTGDTSDNIKGVDGIGSVKANKLIDPLETEEEMIEIIKGHYIDQSEGETSGMLRFYTNADLLWIMRNIGETFSVRKELYGI